MNDNHIRSLEGVERLVNLEKLNVSKNGLQTLASLTPLTHLKKLSNLDINFNHLDVLSEDELNRLAGNDGSIELAGTAIERTSARNRASPGALKTLTRGEEAELVREYNRKYFADEQLELLEENQLFLNAEVSAVMGLFGAKLPL